MKPLPRLLLRSMWPQSLRTRLQAAFVLLFALMLVVTALSVTGMRTSLRTLTGFREEVMPELSRVLELAEKVSQVAAIAPNLADTYAPDALPGDINRLQRLIREIRQLSLGLPAEVDQQLAVSSMLEGAERDLGQLLQLSADRRRNQQILDSYRGRLSGLSADLAARYPDTLRRVPTLVPLFHTLLSVPQARDRAELGAMEADAEALLQAMQRRREIAHLPAWLRSELEVIMGGAQSLFMQRRQVIDYGDRIGVMLQLYRSNAELLSGRTAGYVQQLRSRADSHSRTVGEQIASGISGLLLMSAGGVVVALLAARYVRRVAQQMQAMSLVMSKLAAGDVAQATPATERADEIGDLARAFQVFRDNLLEKQRLSQGLEVQRQLLQTVFSNMHEGLSVYDAAGALLSWNPQFPALLGMSPAVLCAGMSYTAVREALPAGTRWLYLTGDVAARPQGGSIAGSAELQLPDGRVLEFMSHAMPDGGWVAVCRDVSMRRVADAQLQQKQKMEVLGQLTGGVAHDFNNFLVAILGNLELLQSRDDIPDDARRRLERARAAAGRAAGLTRRLLAFARRQPLSNELVDCSDMLHEMLDLLEYSVSPGIGIRIDADPALVVCVDRGQLENAVLNLVLNASQAMGEAGSLQLLARRAPAGHPLGAGEAIVIAVQDTGPGIPPEVLPHVLEPFFTTKEQGKGSGLGLSIVYGFVRQSGGDLQISSRVGDGTTVSLYLPLAAPHCPLDSATQPAPAPVSVRHVLLVEDDPDVRDTACALLQSLGVAVTAVASEAAALAALEDGLQVALVLSDVMLGEGGDGIALHARLAQRWPQLPVVLTSGLPLEYHARRRDWPAGVQLLAKPYQRDELARLLSLGR